MDEATSALDNITQNRSLASLLNYRHTVIMVAHRLTTVKQFDRIVLIEDGRITEEGNYETLMEKNGQFARLVRKQLIQTEEDQKPIGSLLHGGSRDFRRNEGQ